MLTGTELTIEHQAQQQEGQGLVLRLRMDELRQERPEKTRPPWD
jgi:hypothetical protein